MTEPYRSMNSGPVTDPELRAAIEKCAAAGLEVYDVDGMDPLDPVMFGGMGPDAKGGWEVKASGGHRLVVAMAESLRVFLDEHEAVNYTESEIKPAGEVQPYRVIVVRPGKPSPHEIRLQLEQQADRLRRELDEQSAELVRLRQSNDGQPLDEEQVAAMRQALLDQMSATSEERWCAGWLVDLDRILYGEGGNWEAIGRMIGWPLGYEGEHGWVVWDAAGAYYAHTKPGEGY